MIRSRVCPRGMVEVTSPNALIDLRERTGGVCVPASRRQRDRRNLTRQQLNAYIARAVQTIDRRKARGAEMLPRSADGTLQPLPSREGNGGRSAAELSAQLGTSQYTV